MLQRKLPGLGDTLVGALSLQSGIHEYKGKL